MKLFKKKIKLLYYLIFKRKCMFKSEYVGGYRDLYWWCHEPSSGCTTYYTHLGRGWFYKIPKYEKPTELR
jgi:hypothetical protein